MTAEVRVETVVWEAGSRQISTRVRTSEALHERAAELEEAIAQASSIAQESLARVPRRDGWQVSAMEVTFGLTLAAEAGVILSKASAEASFGVTLTVERVPDERVPNEQVPNQQVPNERVPDERVVARDAENPPGGRDTEHRAQEPEAENP
ncbi:CU044_2847 family protein [Streptomyces luteocolor]|uniref:CU044_2847 family protein n=1 Tax=Streptomyces luteocolor TaxID=285500 RepID=UPI000AF97058|nr:CU044_2847 family protein [Streptomyces luteocolor]